MLGPIRLPAPDKIKPATNRAGATIPTNRLVGAGTATGSEFAIDSLDVAGLGKRDCAAHVGEVGVLCAAQAARTVGLVDVGRHGQPCSVA